MNPYLKQYKQTQINTTPKEQILVMLYDGAVRFLHQAKAGFAEKNIEKIHNNIIKVQNIITEFESALDLQNGGDFAQNLFALYEYMSKELSRANIKKEEDALDIVIKHMTELRDTWKEALKQYKAQGLALESNEVDRYSPKTYSTDEYEDTDEDDDEEDDGIGEYI